LISSLIDESLKHQITGLGSKVLYRLPSKLSTVVTSNEDDLKPSSIRPPAHTLSPSDWSRVLLTKILAQVISGNDNQLSSPITVRKCMVGSILLLDDATSHMSEEDEAQLISVLRSTDAAVLLTSNRWAIGRFADRIVVVDGGSVVESGTHSDLLNLGPERSLYARHWRAISAV
jgi:ABC-type hemin transport system ATPase subunit